MIVSTMKENAISGGYVGQRVQEIINDNLHTERELYIQKLSHEFSLCRNEVSKLEKVLQRLQSEREEFRILFEKEKRKNNTLDSRLLEEQIDKLQRELAEANIRFETLMNTTKSEAREISLKHRDECEQLKQQLVNSHSKVEEATREINSLKKEYREAKSLTGMLKDKLIELENEHKEMLKDYSSLKNSIKDKEECIRLKEANYVKLEEAIKKSEKEKQELMDRYDAYNKELSQYNDEAIVKAVKGEKLKRQQLREKVEELNKVIKNLEINLDNHKKFIPDIRQQYEVRIAALNTEITRLKEDTIQKLHEKDMEVQRRITEEQARSAMEIEKLNEECQVKLDTKIAKLEANAQNQLAKAKSSHVEMASILEEKVENMEKTFIPLKKYEENIEEERKKAKELVNREVTLLKEYHEKEIEAKLMNIEASKEIEIEKLTTHYTQKISLLERDISKYKESLKLMEAEILREKAKRNEIEEEKNVLIKEKKKLLKQCEEAISKANECESELKSERHQYQEAKNILKNAKTDSLSLGERYEKLSTNANKLNSEIESLKQKLFTAQEEKEKDGRRLRVSQSENDELQNTIKKVNEEKKQLNARLQRQVNELTSEIQNLHSTNMQIRQKENEKYEKEVKSHTDTKNNLMQAEYKVGELEEEVKELKSTLKKDKEAKLNLEDELKDLKENIKNMQNKLKVEEKEYKKILQQLKETNRIHRLLREKTMNEVLNYSLVIKGQLGVLREKVKEKIAELKKNLNKKMKVLLAIKGELDISLIKKTESTINKKEKQLRAELEKRLVDTENTYEKQSMSVVDRHGIEMKEKEAEIVQLRRICNELEEKNKLLTKQLNSTQANLNEHQELKERLMSENETLKNKVNTNNEELINLRSETQARTIKLKENAENSITLIKQEVDTKYKQQLVFLSKEIQSLKLNSSQQLLELLENISALRNQYQYELDQIIQVHNNQLVGADYLLKLERGKINQHTMEIEKLQEEIDSLKDIHKQRLHDYEDKDKKWKIEKDAEIGLLNKKLNDVMNELEEKIKILEEINKELEFKQKEVRNLKGDLEQQDYIQKQKELEYTNTIFMKEKEIEDLHKMMSRFYNINRSSVHKSLNKSQASFKRENRVNELVKSANKIQTELKLHREVPEDLEGSNLRFSLSQLSSPSSKYN